MRHTVIAIAAIGVLTIAVFDLRTASSHTSRTGGQSTTIRIPESLRTEHQAIHSALVEATKAPGRVGAAAKQLEAVLGPHFKREDEIALPPLEVLYPAAILVGDIIRARLARK